MRFWLIMWLTSWMLIGSLSVVWAQSDSEYQLPVAVFGPFEVAGDTNETFRVEQVRFELDNLMYPGVHELSNVDDIGYHVRPALLVEQNGTYVKVDELNYWLCGGYGEQHLDDELVFSSHLHEYLFTWKKGEPRRLKLELPVPYDCDTSQVSLKISFIAGRYQRLSVKMREVDGQLKVVDYIWGMFGAGTRGGLYLRVVIFVWLPVIVLALGVLVFVIKGLRGEWVASSDGGYGYGAYYGYDATRHPRDVSSNLSVGPSSSNVERTPFTRDPQRYNNLAIFDSDPRESIRVNGEQWDIIGETANGCLIVRDQHGNEKVLDDDSLRDPSVWD